MQGVVLVLLGWLLGAFPAQSHMASRMVLEHHDDACMNLSPAECCQQMLEIALFRATGDQVPRAAKTPVRLSCADPGKTFAETSCRLLSMSRGFNAHDTNEICSPSSLTKRCNGDPSCKQCMSDMDHLEWKGSQRACYALTYVSRPNTDGTRVVTLNDPKRTAANSGNTLTIHHTISR
jgi:hypothetical protein